ncbi:hypothetical protein [Halocella sp. SP3-1]|uniref:hypothetical protein n=1 Tax=Halocella sp. SP3-1 TaxID=2382161 RepID=UPI000F7659CB|nr:hypothetical protein [Halocella sp. SP3-1]AZO95617.1 hypothetical protein D7D81_14040 [Halocella sp. SP3-1]
MKKIIVVSMLVMAASVMVAGNVLALGFGGISEIYFNADWLTDYVTPIEPGELEKGEYRYTFGLARNISSRDYDVYSSSYSYDDIGSHSNTFYSVFDTALTDKLYLNLTFDYVPEYKDNYDDKNKANELGLLLNYSIDDDKNVFFGCINTNSTEKDYDSGDLNYKITGKFTTFYLGTEIRGSFSNMFKKDEK